MALYLHTHPGPGIFQVYVSYFNITILFFCCTSSHDKLFPSVFHCSSGCVNDGLTAATHSHTKLVRSEQSSSLVGYRGSCAFGGKAAKKVSNGDGSQASIFLFSSVEASTAEERGNYGGNLASHHGVHELGEGDCC